MKKTIIVGQTRMVQIARFLGEEDAKKVFINSKGEQFFLPASLRDAAEVGDFVIVAGKEYSSQSIDPATGQGMVHPAGHAQAGEPIYGGEPFQREDAIMVGDYDTVTEAFYADEVLEATKADRIKELSTAFKVARKAPVRKAAPKDNEAEPVLKD